MLCDPYKRLGQLTRELNDGPYTVTYEDMRLLRVALAVRLDVRQRLDEFAARADYGLLYWQMLEQLIEAVDDWVAEKRAWLIAIDREGGVADENQ